jgi:hypothetical protein
MIVKIGFAACIAITCLPGNAASQDKPTSTVTIQLQSCNLRFLDIYRGSITQPRKENDFKAAGYTAKIRRSGAQKTFGFSFMCQAEFNDINQVATHFAGRFNPETRQWVSDFGDAPDGEISRLRFATKTFPLSSKNGNGFYTIQDDLDGEPFRRMRHISYCLFRESKAVCGDGEVKRLADAQGDMLSYALSILRSVEFMESDGVAPAQGRR